MIQSRVRFKGKQVHGIIVSMFTKTSEKWVWDGLLPKGRLRTNPALRFSSTFLMVPWQSRASLQQYTIRTASGLRPLAGTCGHGIRKGTKNGAESLSTDPLQGGGSFPHRSTSRAPSFHSIVHPGAACRELLKRNTNTCKSADPRTLQQEPPGTASICKS